MIEKDNIQELFSKAFENQTSAVRPELWAGVQAKMAAAGVASTAAVATKGLSALTKWIIGSAAVGTVGVVTTVIALNSGEESVNQKEQKPQKESVKVAAATEEASGEHTLQINTPANSGKKETAENQNTIILNKETQENKDLLPYDLKLAEETHPADKKIEPKSEDKKGAEPTNKSVVDDKKANPAPAGSGISKTPDNKAVENPKKYPENTNDPVFAALEAKVTKFPTIFTPNGEGTNDIYFVTAENIDDFIMVIIDQNNREVFRTNIPGEANGWNGRDKGGNEAPSGSYAAIVTGKDQNGKSFRDIQLFELRR
ncbi:gliding motility-associated C-terminal domain-containing protein [Fluviicola sp.]|uniref:T9SS type B sorting domain-containing protein n=1 Tax=Fluviicola sp. TaxID=1917219 RepID=UPI00260933C9|nr:gliding motility-associated C-terminal domain-containing protein [Fluviicola sp.]